MYRLKVIKNVEDKKMEISFKKLSCALFLSLLLTMTLQLCVINQVKATNVAREWGHLARTNNDQTEIQWETWACAAINSYYPVNWDRMSCYGSGTTGTNVYNTIWWCQDYDNWVSTFFVGDFYPSFVSGTKHYLILEIQMFLTWLIRWATVIVYNI